MEGGEPESNDRDATGPRPIWTSTCVLDDQGRGEVWSDVWLQWLRWPGIAHTGMSSKIGEGTSR